MKRKTLEIECWFLVPIRRDSGNREPHQPVLWQLLDEAFDELEVGLTGPEIMDWARKKATVPGVWKRIIDESRKYTVFVPPAKLDALRSLLKKVANSFDQQEILLSVRGRGERVIATPEDGFLE